ncbi:multiple sugar transport system permease protein [Rathayibacter oskolensis]|uniref:Multiple sugar transport system permease protein n=1 Tax=Rathayibacter oskolensis TaxID=1891671 RepID=A0A1X7PEW8_9MICO|nr:carbohydrate ABC transporter permease [Rathayibacter oskolensis]SMH48997.1 multiple sugar transport system permease protein [Rathayibacter oskolensis]
MTVSPSLDARPAQPDGPDDAPRRRSPLLARRPTGNRLLAGWARHAVTIAVLVVMLYPVIWMVDASFKPNAQIGSSLLPFTGDFTLENYSAGLTSTATLNFGVFFFNSFVLAILCVVGNVVACTLTGYAFARLRFPFKRTLFAVLMGTLLLPYQVTIVPQYILFNELGWLNSYLPLVVPKFLATDAFFVFLTVQFIRGLPRELDEAARLDGCGDWGIFRRVIVPLLGPAIATTAMFTFIATWNDFLGPRLYISDTALYTVPQGLVQFVDSTGQSSIGALFAMATLSITPLVAFFLASQRLLTQGIATTGLK